jgi:hypothetical protein
VHGPLGEQLEDCRTHVTALAASSATPAAATGTETEAGPAETGSTEAGTTEAEAGTEASEAGVATVLTHMVAEVATGLTALFVNCPTIDGAEAESAGGGWSEGAFWGCEWGVHGLSP